MERHQPELSAAGLRLLAVGLGQPEHAERYCGTLAPSLRCFAAPTNDPYSAWGLQRRTFGAIVTHAVDIAAVTLKAAAQGHRQGKATGDIQMMPGTFIVDTQGVIRYTYYGQYAGDDPAIPELLAAAANLARAREA